MARPPRGPLVSFLGMTALVLFGLNFGVFLAHHLPCPIEPRMEAAGIPPALLPPPAPHEGIVILRLERDLVDRARRHQRAPRHGTLERRRSARAR